MIVEVEFRMEMEGCWGGELDMRMEEELLGERGR